MLINLLFLLEKCENYISQPSLDLKWGMTLVLQRLEVKCTLLILAIKSLMPPAMLALLFVQPNMEDSLNDVVEDMDGALGVKE